jgi:RNA polymerase sigma-70 factor (ECF subfamily)
MDGEVWLMQRIAGGEQAAFEEFAERYGAELRGLCRARAHSPNDADDLYQEALLRVWRKALTFTGRSGLRTWLYRLVANLAVDEHRRLARLPTPAERLPEPALDQGTGQGIDGAAALSDELRRALERIAPHYRQVAVLSDCCGLPDREVARMCGIAEATVRTRLHRARKALRALLTEEEAA